MKNKILLFAMGAFALAGSARAEYLAIGCKESEEAFRTLSPYILTAVNETKGMPGTEFSKLEDGYVLVGTEKYAVQSIDSESETTWALYNGDFFRRSWPVTIVKARSAAGKALTLRFFADHGSKNAMYGSVVLEGSGLSAEYKYCTDSMF